MSARTRLPARRQSITVAGAWPIDGGVPLHISIGLDDASHVREIFARAKRPDTDLDNVVDDGAVLVSLLLQYGASLAEIEHSLGRSSDGQATSVIGQIVDIAREIEAEIRASHATEAAI
jgi:hypothetical protein